MDAQEIAEVFKALSSDRRVEIVRLLSKQCLCAGAIAGRLDISPSSASQHLRILKSAGLVNDCRCGSHIHYSLDGDRMSEVSSMAGELFEGEDPQCDTECGKNEDCGTRKGRGG